jgi:hypothetical protein
MWRSVKLLIKALAFARQPAAWRRKLRKADVSRGTIQRSVGGLESQLRGAGWEIRRAD